jgi:hypothetical protein
LRDDALPDSFGGGAPIGGGYHLNGGLKFAQVGDDAMEKLLASSVVQLNDSAKGSKSGVVLMDLNVHVGNLSRAYVTTWSQMQIPVFYFGLCADETEREFIAESVVDVVKCLWLDGKMKLPNDPLPAEPPVDVVLAVPPRPALKVLVLKECPGDIDTVELPEHLIETYFRNRNQDLANLFRDGLTTIDTECGLSLVSQGEAPDDGGPPSKKPRVDPQPADPVQTEPTAALSMVDATAVQGQLAGSCVMQNARPKGSMEVRSYSGGMLLLANIGTEPTKLDKHMSVVMFGKGAFVKVKPDEILETDVLFELNSNATEVVFNNRVVAVGSLIEQQRAKDPTLAKVCYHDMTEVVVPGAPGSFALTVRHHVLFRPNKVVAREGGEEGLQVQQGSFGTVLPLAKWTTAGTRLVWCVKWSKKGIQPVAPRVVTTSALEIAAGKAAVLS